MDAPYTNPLVAFVYNWQTLGAGLLALVAGIAAYRAAVMELNETRNAVKNRKQAHAAIAALECQRIEAEAKKQSEIVRRADGQNLEVRYTLTTIDVGTVLREWEQLGSLAPDTMFAVYHLLDAIGNFNGIIRPRDELDQWAAGSMLSDIQSIAATASRLLMDELEKI